MSTTSLTAGEVMDRSAALLNDPAKTDFTYLAQLVYLNMAIDELVENLEESNVSPTNQTSVTISVPKGSYQITPIESVTTPHYPVDLIEIQEVSERASGSSDAFLPLGRKEFLSVFPPSNSLLYWIWEDQIIKFNPNGATTSRDVQLRYVRQAISQAASELSVIGTINARSYLSYKTAALCAQFIGENESRAKLLEDKAEEAIERMTGISNKGRQQIMTRHRPFRAGYKSRGILDMSPGLRDHEPLVIEQFNGWFDRGDDESCPSDHFTQSDNVQYFNSGFETRDPLDKYQTGVPLGKVLRLYNYVMQTGQSLLVLTEGGKIYHCIGPATVYGPILTIAAMEDFGFCAYNGRAYITPFKSYVNPQGVNYELGILGEFVYVYKGDGTAARKAAGAAPTNAGKLSFLAYDTPTDGVITRGIHVIAVSFNSGVLGTEVFPVVIAPGDKQIQLSNIPIGPIGTTSRDIVMTQAIPNETYKADQFSYVYYFVENIPDNTTKSKIINIADENLLVAYVPGPAAAPSDGGALRVANTDIDGFCDFGFHLVGVIFETDTGYLTAPGPENFGGNTYVDTKRAVKVSNIPISPDPAVKKRHLVSTKWIPEYNGDQKGYQFFFIPKGTLENNTATELVVSYYDSDLLSDASHLSDNFASIPAGVNLNTYHSRMVLVGDGSSNFLEDGTTIDTKNPDNRSVARVSAPGEPEAISKVDGLIIAPLDGNPLTNVQEFRDVLYLFKKTRTYAYSDNNDEPATWVEETLDQGVGAPVHGIGTVLDTGGVNTDFLVVADWSGLMLFNGVYARPEISWKIEDYWMSLIRNNFRYIQLVNDSLSKKIWMTLPPPNQYHILYCDYGNGLDAKNVRWSRWIFDAKISALCLIETNKLIVGAVANASV